MSPVFRHGRLRLYLLKLLDESPRHGYEVIRLLQDRFMGVYAPSPGTIYPRLARLEEEGLVTHDEADGRKVYRITEKGREELRQRSGDLSELEEEISASVRDIAREVTEDVRETVRNLRRELSFAARDVQQRGPGADAGRERPGDRREHRHGERERLEAEWRRLEAEQQRLTAQREHLQAERERLEAESRRTAADAAGGQAREGRGGRSRARGWDWGWAGGNWRGNWAGGNWAGGDWAGGDWGGLDLEQLARHFTAELRLAAAHAHEASEQAAGELRTILDEALDRIKSEVFRAGGHPGARPGPGPGAGPAERPARSPGVREKPVAGAAPRNEDRLLLRSVTTAVPFAGRYGRGREALDQEVARCRCRRRAG